MNNQTPTTLLHTSMTQSAKLAARTRRILEKQLRSIEREMTATATPPGRLAELAELTVVLMQALDRSIEGAGKLLTLKHSPSVPTEDPSSVERVMQELTHGKMK
jgi:hypothetical protein